MDDMTPPASERRDPLFYVGAAGLLITTAVETAAVIGRRLGVPLTGALELAQAAIVPAACAAMLIATLRGTHAAVHLLTDRMSATTRRRALAAGSLLAGLCFTALAAGSAWLAAEYWNSFEQTEVLHIPFRPLRALVTLTAASLAVVCFRHALRPAESA